MEEEESDNGMCVWDFTYYPDDIETERKALITQLEASSKKWCFQLEECPKTKRKHFQGRISLKVKTRQPSRRFKLAKGIRFSITSNENKGNDFYVCKEDSKLEGPWSDKDEKPLYIPRQIREIQKLRPWQQMIVDDANIWDTRTINVIIDQTGNHGKSILKTWVGVYGIGRAIPFTNDYRDIMRMVMDTKKKPLYIIDVPRALKKDQLFQFFSGVETLKDGYAYDDRYAFKEEYFDSPNIWIMMNTLPDTDYLSKDRWKIWSFNEAGELVRDEGIKDLGANAVTILNL